MPYMVTAGQSDRAARSLQRVQIEESYLTRDRTLQRAEQIVERNNEVRLSGKMIDRGDGLWTNPATSEYVEVVEISFDEYQRHSWK